MKQRLVKILKKSLRAILAFILIWCVCVEVVALFASSAFSLSLDGDWFLVLANSNSNEMKSFLVLYASEIIFGFFVFLSLSLALTLLALKAHGRYFTWLMLTFVLYISFSMWRDGSLKAWKPFFLVYDTIRGYHDFTGLADAGKWDAERARDQTPAPPNATNIVFVLGESMTTDRMSAYGYPRPTTPRLDASRHEVAILGPLRAAFPDTARALRAMFARTSPAHTNFLTGAVTPAQFTETMAVRYRQRGYRTAIISAQSHWEKLTSVEQRLFDACETQIYLETSTPDHPHFDHDLIPAFKAEIAQKDSRPFIIFVHMMGSHYDPADRLPPHFIDHIGLDLYDRTILYSDAVIAELAHLTPTNTLFIYTSDHGESPDASSWRQIDNPSIWRVPLIVRPASAASLFLQVTNTVQIMDALP